MGSALYVSIKDRPADLDWMMNGKPLARAWDALDAIAQAADVPPISKLCNASWKLPDKGLLVFQKYLAFVEANPANIPDAPDVIDDLKDVVRLIGEAKRLNSKWRLMLDY
jgi:hypothetical protein